MKTLARAFPITSKEALLALGRAVDEWSAEDKSQFFTRFGRGQEKWFYQEIDGRPHVISVVEAESLDEGFEAYGRGTDPFTKWFHEQVFKLTDVDMTRSPKGPPSELIYELKGL